MNKVEVTDSMVVVREVFRAVLESEDGQVIEQVALRVELPVDVIRYVVERWKTILINESVEPDVLVH